MNNRLLSFLCGGAVGAAAASVVWSVSGTPAAPAAAEPPAAEAPPVAAAAPAAGSDAPAAPAPAAEPALPEAAVAAVEEVPAPDAPPPPQPAPPQEETERPRRGPPRWENLTDEQREEMRQRFRRMHDEHATRAVETFVERNGLAEDAGERVFAVVDAMNERVLARIGLWTDYARLQGGERLSRDQGALMMRDLFDDLVNAYGELDEAFGSDWRENDPDFDLGRMVDPEVWGSLFRLGGGFGGPGPRGFGGPRGGRGPGGGRGGGPGAP